MAKRLCDLPLSGNLPKKPKLIEAQEASKIVGSSPSLLETVNGKVRKIPADPFGEYCKEMRNECMSFLDNFIFASFQRTEYFFSIFSALPRSTHELYRIVTEFEQWLEKS